MITFGDLALDALTEIFNIGVGSAADLLSQMVRGEKVSLSVPLLRVVPRDQLVAALPMPAEQRLCAIRQLFAGPVNTEAILMFPEDRSRELVRIIVGAGAEVPLAQITEMEQDALGEVGNIILNSVVAALADQLALTFDGGLPTVEVCSVADLFTAAGRGEAVLLLQIDFDLAERAIHGDMAFILDVASVDALTRSIDTYLLSISA